VPAVRFGTACCDRGPSVLRIGTPKKVRRASRVRLLSTIVRSHAAYVAVPEYQWGGPARNGPEPSPSGHLVTTRSTRILSVDAIAAVLLQRPAEVLEQKPLAALVDLEERAAFRERLVTLDADGVIADWRLRVRGPAGEWIDVVATVRPAAGEAELRWTIAADPHGTALREEPSYGEASEMGRELRQLAHELNQPLAAIVTYARGTQMRLDSKMLSDADLRAALEVIVKEAMRATEIVRALDRKWGSSS